MKDVIDVEAIEETTSKVLATMDNYVAELRRTPEQAKAIIAQVDACVKAVMEEGIDKDYATIPGTPKPSLLKPGAEKLALFFGLGSVSKTTEQVEDWDKRYFKYTVEVGVGPIDQDGNVKPIHWCPGSCNSRERKFQSQVDAGRAGDILNSMLKRAHKRAFVGAVLLTTNSSNRFTCDVEEMPREMLGNDDAPLMPPVKHPAGGPLPPEQYVIQFGKHAGTTLGQIPAPYLAWLKGQLEKKQAEGSLPEDQQSLLKAVQEVVG